MKNIIHRSRFKKLAVRANPLPRSDMIINKDGLIASKVSIQTVGLNTGKSTGSKNENYLIDICHRTVGERLNHLRSRAKMNLNQAAEITNISRAELSRIEKDMRNISEYHLRKLSAAYKISLSELKDILDYKYQSRVRVIPAIQANTGPVGNTLIIPLVLLSDLLRDKASKEPANQLAIPQSIQVSASAYAVEMNTLGDDAYLLPSSLVIVDPEKRIRVGDLVLNNENWNPPLIQLHRGANNALSGKCGDKIIQFREDVQLNRFQKVVIFFPSHEQWRDLLHQK